MESGPSRRLSWQNRDICMFGLQPPWSAPLGLTMVQIPNWILFAGGLLADAQVLHGSYKAALDDLETLLQIGIFGGQRW